MKGVDFDISHLMSRLPIRELNPEQVDFILAERIWDFLMDGVLGEVLRWYDVFLQSSWGNYAQPDESGHQLGVLHVMPS